MNNTEKTISKLVKTLQPITPLKSPIYRTMMWFLYSFIVITIIATLGQKLEGPHAIPHTFSYIDFLLLILTFVLTSISLFQDSLPGSPSTKTIKKFSRLSLTLWVLLYLTQLPHTQVPTAQWLPCVLITLIAAIFPFLYILKKLSTIPKIATHRNLNTGLSCALLGGISIHIICPSTNAIHILTSHGMSILLIATTLHLIQKVLKK